MIKSVVSEPSIRMTRQRRVILEILSRENWHPSGDQVYRLARRRLPRISLGTVYRNLDILSGQGLIQKLEVSGRQRRFDGKVSRHYHAHCVGCGRVEDLMASTPVAVRKAASGLRDWEILGHRLEITGLCPKCRSGSPGPAESASGG